MFYLNFLLLWSARRCCLFSLQTRMLAQPPLLCHAVCCASRRSCLSNVILRSPLSITQCSFLRAASLFLPSASFSLCRYLCCCICAPLLRSVSSHPHPTHTHRPHTVGSVDVHRSTRDNFFFFPPPPPFFSIRASHLAA